VAEPGQVLEGPDGFLLRLREIGDEALVMEASYSGTAPMPPEHFHPGQTERFEVIEGAMRALIGGEERVYGPGEPFEVPAGTPHQMAAQEPTRMRWEVRPAMRTAEFFERLYAAIAAENWAEIPAIMDEFRAEVVLTGK
jgi:mannose-6-phosphate isomerase-like protein (cupin superfamily)